MDQKLSKPKQLQIQVSNQRKVTEVATAQRHACHEGIDPIRPRTSAARAVSSLMRTRAAASQSAWFWNRSERVKHGTSDRAGPGATGVSTIVRATDDRYRKLNRLCVSRRRLKNLDKQPQKEWFKYLINL